MNENDLRSPSSPLSGRGSAFTQTLDEEWMLSAQLMASAARGPLRRASLEDLVAARDEWASRNVRRRLILGLLFLLVLCAA